MRTLIAFLDRRSMVIAGLLAWAALSLPSPLHGQIVIVVNKGNDVSDLPLDQVKKIFMGDKGTWPSGRRVSVLTRQGGQAEREAVLKQIYKMGEADYTKYFMQAAFTGRITAPPKEVGSAAEMKRAVADNPGAIGYIKKEDVDDSVKAVLTIP